MHQQRKVFTPAARVTVAGTGNAALLLERATEAPPAGAAALSEIARSAPEPPRTLDGVTASDASDGSTTTASVTPAVLLAPS